MSDTFNAVRSISATILESIAQYRTKTGMEPKEIHIHPVLYDAWRAEMLATGKIKPLQPFNRFAGMRVESVSGVGSCELK